MEANVAPSDAAMPGDGNSDPRMKIISNLQSAALSMLEDTESFFRDVVGVDRATEQDATK
jgi:hypothetical protein